MIKLILIILITFFLLIFFKEVNFLSLLKKKLKISEKIWEKYCLISLNKKNDNFISIMNKLGDFYISIERDKEASNIYEKIYLLNKKQKIKNNIVWNLFSGLAIIAEKKGNFDLAIEYIKRGEIIRGYFDLEESPKHLEKNCIILSKCFTKIGDKKRALGCLNRYSINKEMLKITEVEVLLDFFDYKKAKNLLELLEKNSLNGQKIIDLDYFLCVAFLGEKKYDTILEISQRFDVSKSINDNAVFVLYASAIAYIKQKKYIEAKQKIDRIYSLIIYRLNIKDFYKFYYDNFLLYYALGYLNSSQKKYIEAKQNYEKILEIIEIIPETRFKYMIERVNIYFFKLLASFEIIKIEKNQKIKKEKLKTIKSFLNKLKLKEKKLITLIEIGNGESIINKINNLK